MSDAVKPVRPVLEPAAAVSGPGCPYRPRVPRPQGVILFVGVSRRRPA